MTEPLHIPRTYVSMLRTLRDNGDSGTLDRYGRVMAGPEHHILSGGPVEWLWLAAHGLVKGSAEGALSLTESGAEAVAGLDARQVAPVPDEAQPAA